MIFPRQAKIFRGQLDAAPVAGVVLLLLIFMKLDTVLYTPGVLVQLNNPAAAIRVSADGSIYFGNNSFKEADTNLLRAALQKSPAGPPFDIQADPAAPPRVAASVRDVVGSIYNPAATIRVSADGRIHFGAVSFTEADTNQLRDALRISAAGPPFYLQLDPDASSKVAARARAVVNSVFQIRLPGGPRNIVGTDNPTVLVAVNFLGQYFYDNQIVGERDLKEKLRARLEAAARESKELTLTVAGDEQVNWNAVILLAQWAWEIGIRETVLAEWPGKLPSAQAKPSH